MAKNKNDDSTDIAVLQDWRNSVEEKLSRIEQKIDNLDKKFAAKWVQSIVSGLVAAILLTFIGVVANYFIPHHDPTTAQTTTTTTPTGSTSTTTTIPTPAASATATSHSDTTTPSSSQTTTSPSINQGVLDALPKGL